MDRVAHYVAFLRAINVGGHVVRMDRLVKLFETLGPTGVETFLASGNVLFDASASGGGGGRSRPGLRAPSGRPWVTRPRPLSAPVSSAR